jgi:hypothetical protein
MWVASVARQDPTGAEPCERRDPRAVAAQVRSTLESQQKCGLPVSVPCGHFGDAMSERTCSMSVISRQQKRIPSLSPRTGPSVSLRTGPSVSLRTGPSVSLRTGPSVLLRMSSAPCSGSTVLFLGERASVNSPLS